MPPPREDDSPPDDDRLDGDGPAGNGTADTAATVECPHCGEAVEITLDPDGGATQQYVQDCEVCCRPWQVNIAYDADGQAEVSVTALDD